jgi:hypothetical protein
MDALWEPESYRRSLDEEIGKRHRAFARNRHRGAT